MAFCEKNKREQPAPLKNQFGIGYLKKNGFKFFPLFKSATNFLKSFRKFKFSKAVVSIKKTSL